MKLPFLFFVFLLSTQCFSQDTITVFKSYNAYSSILLYTDPYYPSCGMVCCVPSCHSTPCITKAKRDSLQVRLNEMNAGAEGWDHFYFMLVNECNCQVEIISNYKWPKGESFVNPGNTISGEQMRRSPLRSSNPTEMANSLFIGFQ